jgi:hypothetical protein
MSQSPGLFMIGLPEPTLQVVQAIGKKTGMREAEVISEAINEMYKRVLAKEQAE